MKKWTRLFASIPAGVVLVVTLLAPVASSNPSPAQDDRIFELRTYTTYEGKLDDLHRRFRDHTNRLFVKHGMTLIGYWTPIEEPQASNTLIYVLAYPSREAREKAWQAFRDDPEWKRVYEESHRDGRIVKEVQSVLMKATDYSPIQ